MIPIRLLARCQIAHWRLEEVTATQEALAAAPMGEFLADLFFVSLAALLGLQPLWIDRSIWLPRSFHA